MAKSILDEMTAYRVKVERDGREIVNVPGILALPAALIAPKLSVFGMIAAPLLGCSLHLENEAGQKTDIGKAVREAADTIADTAATAAKTVKEEINKAWDAISADDPEGCPEGEENEEETTGQDNDAEVVPPEIQVKPEDPEKQ